MNLLLLEANEIAPDGVVALTDQRARHLIRVLRVTPGQRIRIGALDGPLGEGVVRSISADAVMLSCTLGAEVPPRPAVDLILALPRPKVLQRLWAQLAAIGIGHVALTNAEKVERDYFDAHAVTPAIYRPLLVEGLQQARDTRVPTVSIHKQFRAVVEDRLDDIFGRGVRMLAEPAASHSIDECIAQSPVSRVLLAIGPEGGWNTFERELLAAHGFSEVGAGARTLRSDTATVALLSLAHDAVRRHWTRPDLI
jgi:RsmE family RNA methyltransferase